MPTYISRRSSSSRSWSSCAFVVGGGGRKRRSPRSSNGSRSQRSVGLFAALARVGHVPLHEGREEDDVPFEPLRAVEGEQPYRVLLGRAELVLVLLGLVERVEVVDEAAEIERARDRLVALRDVAELRQVPQGELRLGVGRRRQLRGEAGAACDLADEVGERDACRDPGELAPGREEARDPLARVVGELCDLVLDGDRVGELVREHVAVAAPDAVVLVLRRARRGRRGRGSRGGTPGRAGAGRARGCRPGRRGRAARRRRRGSRGASRSRRACRPRPARPWPTRAR